jgi:hypothetical protein
VAFSEIYVDPSIAADSGTGTIGDPFGDLEYAIEQTTFDTTNGTRVNIKAGVDEVLAAELGTAMADAVTTPAWVPDADAPAVFRGYTAVAGDGGIGGISGGGSVSIFNASTLDYVVLQDLHLHNTGANPVVRLDDYIQIIHCDIENSTAEGVSAGNYSQLMHSYIHNVDGTHMASMGTIAFIYANIFDDEGATPSNAAISMSGGEARDNIVIVSGATNGIRILNSSKVANNSVYSSGGTGKGIHSSTATGVVTAMNNTVEGFSGVGGTGIDINQSDVWWYMTGNAVYDCTTAYDSGLENDLGLGDNETLTASPFTDAANGDFSLVDIGNVREGALPQVIGGGFG